MQASTPTTPTDGFNSQKPTFSTVVTLWGGFTASPGSSEREHAQQQQPVNVQVIRLRYWRYLTTKHRLVMEGRTFAVDAIVDVNERHRVMDVRVKEVQ